ncbi:MAG: type II/IV secretion system protein [Deltaproteobacteria bacterium]|nr:type II/IV secretion system protein [Deltaproteobacteria bacterium]
MDFDTGIKEAEIYRSMGLLNESLIVYDEVLAAIPNDDTKHTEFIKKSIRVLKKEIESQETHAPAISQKEISVIREAIAVDGQSGILDNALAFKQLGLMNEAVTEYEKLFETDYPIIKIIPDFVECLLNLVHPDDVVKRLHQVVGKLDLQSPQLAQIRFSLGLQLEDGGHKDLALDQFKSASKLDPANREIAQKLKLGLSAVSPGSRYSYLLKKRSVTLSQLQQALTISKKIDKSVEFVLIDHFKVSRETIGKSLSEFYDCPFRTFDADLPVPVEIIRNLKQAYLLHAGWVPLSWSKKGLEILMDDPRDLRKIDQVTGLMKATRIEFSVGIREDIERFIQHFFENKPEKPDEAMLEELDMISFVSFEEEEEDEVDHTLNESSSKIVKLIDQVIVTAFRNNASDIHIEPSVISKKTHIRFRTDGVCQNYIEVPISMARGMISRIKIMAGLDIAEKRLPQDGKIKFKRKGIRPFELRLATLPTAGGVESAALRILADPGAMKLEDMGLNDRNIAVLKKTIQQPHGLILAAGPTGSGKTTALHAALGVINEPNIKIWTAEDPVEITQPGMSQVEVKPKIGLDFARVMRSFLRADPDVIMIGEMRDFETASIAVEASLTGHLVFSTLHTNSAPETVTRLLDMGLNTLNFSDAFLCVLAQRLIRRLCLACRKGYHPSKEAYDEIVNDYGIEYFNATGIEYSEKLLLYAPVGCEECSQTGYKGRMVIHELMEGTPHIKQLIKERANLEILLAQSLKEGMTTLKQDGIEKVFKGLTDIHEVRRICIK